MRAGTLAVVLTALATSGAWAQDSVRLLRTARVEAGTPVHLRDIARLEGPGAERLGRLAVAADASAEAAGEAGWFEITPERVRRVLEAELGRRSGMVAVSGTVCSVRVGQEPVARAADGAPSPAAPAPDAGDLVGLATVRGALARELCRILSVDPASLRLEFEDRDGEFLDTPLAGRVLEIDPVGSSDRMPVAVTVHGPGAAQRRETVRVGVLVRRHVAVASRMLERGQTVSTEDVSIEERWLTPADLSVGAEDAQGAVARRRVKPGETLERQDIEPPVVVHRGDRVWVRVVTAGLVVRREAHATEDGREGEMILFAAASDSRERFVAVVTGPGQALASRPAGTAIATAGASD